MKRYTIFRIFLFFLLLMIFSLLPSCLVSKQENEKPVMILTNTDGKGFQFELEFFKGKAHSYPLMAVWLEDIHGTYIQTLFVAQSVGKGEFNHADVSTGKWTSGPLQRPATLPYWAHKYNSKAQQPDVFPSVNRPVPDVYTGATPKHNFTLFSKSDLPINQPFRVLFEINQFFDFNDFWTNNKFPDDKDYLTSGQPAIIFASDAIYTDKLPLTFTLRPIGHSHHSGKDGGIYISLETISSAKQIVSEINVTVRK
jgi:hypothetical protein